MPNPIMIKLILLNTIFLAACGNYLDEPKSKFTFEEQLERSNQSYDWAMEKQKKYGAAVLGELPNVDLPSPPIIQTNSQTCFDLSELPAPWFITRLVQDKENDGYTNYFILAVPSEALNVSIYEVFVPDYVQYDYIVTDQAYVRMFIGTERLGESKRAFTNFRDDILEVSKKIENEFEINLNSKWNFETFIMSDWTHKDANRVRRSTGRPLLKDTDPVDSGILIVDQIKRASFYTRESRLLVQKDKIETSLRPTDGFFKTPTGWGEFFDTEDKYKVQFEMSARATYDAPRIISTLEAMVSKLEMTCP